MFSTRSIIGLPPPQLQKVRVRESKSSSGRIFRTVSKMSLCLSQFPKLFRMRFFFLSFFWIEVHRSFAALNYSYDGTTESVWFYWEEYRRFKEGIYFFFSRGEWRNRKMFLGFFFVSQTRRIPLNFWILLFRKFENVLLFISRIPKYKNRDKSKIS